MTREKHKWLKPRGERTEVGHWDGPICKSDEGSVMGLEQRDRVRWLHQRATGNRMKRCLPIRLTHTLATCRVRPVAGIKFVIGRCLCITSDAEQRAEGVERVEAPVKAKREFVEVGL